MTSINTPEQPRRRIEIVPLLQPDAPSASVSPTARGAWREPAIATSVHEPAQFASRPNLSHRVWVIGPVPELPHAAEPPMRGAQDRLHALLLRERTALLAHADSNTDATPQPPRAERDPAPFPLPTNPPRNARPQRSPKARRLDASARPLAADVAAAIARATGHEQPPPPAPNLSLVPRTTARDRLDIVALADPAEPDAHAPHASGAESQPGVINLPDPQPAGNEHPKPSGKIQFPHTIDLRERRRLRNRTPLAYQCPRCDSIGIVDLIDNITGTVTATCPRCLEMWTTQMHPDHSTIDPR